jgi:hypothetical protein
MEGDEVNSPNTEQIQRDCHDTLPWLISVSLGACRDCRGIHTAIHS